MISRRTLPWISATAARVDKPEPERHQHQRGGGTGRCRLARPSRADGLPDCGRHAPRASPPCRRSGTAAASRPRRRRTTGRSGDRRRWRSVSAISSGDRRVGGDERRGGRVRSGRNESRNSAAPGMRAARPSGQSEKASAVSSAVAGGEQRAARGRCPRTGGTGSTPRSQAVSAIGASGADHQADTMPHTASPSTWIRQTARTRPGRGAEAAQRGDRPRTRLEPRADAVGDPDAADEQRRQPDQRDEQAGLVDEAAHAGGGVMRVANAPPLAGEVRAEFGQDRGGRSGSVARTAYCTIEPGTIRPVDGQRVERRSARGDRSGGAPLPCPARSSRCPGR